VVSGKSYSLLDVLRRSGVDAYYWYVPLLTRNAERGVEVTALDGSVGKGVRLVVGVFGGTRLVRTPHTAVPASEYISTVSCGRAVARGGRWDRVDQWLGDFRREGLELGIGRPTPRSKCTAAVLGRYRFQAESDGQESREEKHDCSVRLGCRILRRVEGIYRVNPTSFSS
jgi:hypothetical protein